MSSGVTCDVDLPRWEPLLFDERVSQTWKATEILCDRKIQTVLIHYYTLRNVAVEKSERWQMGKVCSRRKDGITWLVRFCVILGLPLAANWWLTDELLEGVNIDRLKIDSFSV